MKNYMIKGKTIAAVLGILLLLPSGILIGCRGNEPQVKTVPHITDWGIYKLDIATQDISLIFSFATGSFPSGLRLNNTGDKFVFAQKANNQPDESTEIYTIGVDGKNLTKLTENNYWDLYPVWSPDDAHIAFLSQREKDLDIYVMDADGKNTKKLYDSGDNDADIDWVENSIVFTSKFAIWMMHDDGTQAIQVTNYPDRGKWGKANLPLGDYDPRLSPDGKKVAFERLENTDDPHGGYNIFVINANGTSEFRLTSNGYSQGLVNWSKSGEELTYVVAAIDGQGKYDIYIMNSDGTDNCNIQPDYFPAGFLCHYPNFSGDDSGIYFIGQWWTEN